MSKPLPKPVRLFITSFYLNSLLVVYDFDPRTGFLSVYAWFDSIHLQIPPFRSGGIDTIYVELGDVNECQWVQLLIPASSPYHQLRPQTTPKQTHSQHARIPAASAARVPTVVGLGTERVESPEVSAGEISVFIIAPFQ
jgi:hypothetical protein